MKIIIKILGVLVLVVVILLGVSLYYLDSGIKKAVETVGPQYTKTHVELRDVNLSPLSGKGTLAGLSVGNPPGFSDAKAFYLGEISITVDMKTLRADPVIIHSVRIVAPEISFEQGKHNTNLQQLLKNIEQATGPSASTSDGSEETQDEAKKTHYSRPANKRWQTALHQSVVGRKNTQYRFARYSTAGYW